MQIKIKEQNKQMTILYIKDSHDIYELLFSYNTCIAKKYIKRYTNDFKKIYLDSKYWDYSTTTSKHLNYFLNETKKETEAKIKSGEYLLTDLNN